MIHKNKKIQRTKWKIPIFLLVFLIITAWLFSGYPPIWQEPRIPPLPEEAKASISSGTVGTEVNFNGTNPTISITTVATDDFCVFQAFDMNATAPSGITETSGSDTWTAASNPGTTDVWIGQWYLNNPTPESKTIQLTITSGRGFMNVVCFQGTEPTSPINDARSLGTTNTSGDPVSHSFTTDYDNSWIVSVCGSAWSTTPTLGAGQNSIWSNTQGGGTKYAAAGSDELLSTAGSDTQSCDMSRSAADKGIHSIEVREYVVPTITVTGNVYSDETPTFYNCNSDPLTIKIGVDGGAATTGPCTATNGTYSIDVPQPAGPGSEVIVYIDSGETPNATTITLAADSASDIIGLHLYQNRVAVTYEDGSSITNTNLYDADNTDAGIRYEVTGTDLLTDSGMELHVWTGKTYDPGGEVDTTSGDLHLDDTSTAYIDAAGSVIDGNIIVDGGSSPTTLQFQANTTVAGGAITTPDGGGTNAVINTSGSPTVTITGTGDIGGGTSPSITFSGLIIGTGTAAATTVVSSMIVEGTLDVDTGDSLSINSSQTVTHTGATMTLDGDIVGAGTLRFTDASGGPGAGAGTLSAIVRYDASAGNIASTTFDARTYSGVVEIFSDDSAVAAREVAMANATYTLSGGTSHLYVINNSNSWDLTLDGALNPTVSVGGNLDYTGSGSNSEIITSGNATWTVSDSVTFTDGTYTATAGNTLVMSGSGTLTHAAQDLQNLTLSGGSITMAAATYNIAGNLNLSGTVDGSSATVNMTGTSNSIVGGTNTLNVLNIDPASAGTITLQTSALTVTSTLTVAAGDELVINTTTLTHTDSSDVAGSGNITGTGTLIFDDGSGGPGTTITTLSSAVRFDASGGNVATGTFDVRAYEGRIEFYADNSGPDAPRSVAMAASTYTFSGASSHLYIINDNDTHTLTLDGALNPTVNIEGDLDFTGGGGSSEEITTGTGVWTVSGSINLTDGNVAFTAGNIFQVNGSSKTITSDSESFLNFSVTGTGDVSNIDQLNVTGDFSIGATATFTHGNNVDFLSTGTGDTAFVIADGGTFDSSGAGTGKLILDGADASFDDQTDPGEQNMGDVQIGQSPGTTKLRSDFAADSLTIADGDVFETHGWEVDIVGNIDCLGTCTFDLQDDIPNRDTTNPTTVTFGGNWTMSATGTFIPFTNSIVRPDGTADQTVTTNSKAFWDFYIINTGGANDDIIISSGTFDVDGDLTVQDGELDLNTNNPTTDVEGDITITTVLTASGTNPINAAGNWDNNGTFTSNSGTVNFDSDNAATVEAGAQSFGVVVFNHASGEWTVQTNDMTTSGDLTLTAATAFNLEAGRTLEVQGNFTLTILDAVTSWGAGSTLYLNGSGGMWEINTKGHGGDTFVTLQIGTSEDIAMWDSQASAYSVGAGGCLYSQDHEDLGGSLYIDGTCSTRTGGEWWNYADDFDGTGGANRQVSVSMDDGASYTVDSGETLEITGESASANPTLITRDTTGTYSMTIDGTIDAQYYEFDYMDANGLNITSTATVTELSDGSFDNAGEGSASYITVTGITSDDEFRNNIFDDNGDGVDGSALYNVNADNSGGSIYWKFLLWDGNKGGEINDNEANGATVDWSENLSFVISDNIMDLGVISNQVIGTDSHNLTVTTNAVNGYGCSVVEDGNLRNGANFITDVADNTVSVGVEEYGISCTAGADCQLSGFDVAITGSPLEVASNGARVTASATTMTYEAAATGTTAGVTYSHEVTFTCAGDF